MKRKIPKKLFIFIFFLLFTCCSASPDSYPWICSNIDGVVADSTIVNRNDDFYLYVNKQKIIDLEIDDGKYTSDFIAYSTSKRTERVLNLLQNFEGELTEDNKNVLNVYSLVADWNKRDYLGVEPLRKVLQLIDGVSSVSDLSSLFADSNNYFLLKFFFDVAVSLNPNDSESYILCIIPSSFLISTDTYNKYTIDELLNFDVIGYYEYLLTRLGFGEDTIRGLLYNAFLFERSLASASSHDRADIMRSIETGYTFFTSSELKAISGDFDILGIIQSLFEVADVAEVLVEQKSWLNSLIESFDDNHLVMIKAYAKIKCLNLFGQLLDSKCLSAAMLYSKESGYETYKDQEIIANSVIGLLPWSVSFMYVQHYGYFAYEPTISSVKNGIVESYCNLIMSSENLNQDAKDFLTQKIARMKFYLLFPEDWEPYLNQSVSIGSYEDGETLVSAYIKCQTNTLNRYRIKYKSNDAYYWNWVPMDFVGNYTPASNSVYLSLILIDGVFSPDSSFEEILATLGFSIAHEIAHSFEGASLFFDSYGNLMDEPNHDIDVLVDSVLAKLIDYLNKIVPMKNQYLDGNLVCEEMFADICAMHCLLDIAGACPGFDYDVFFRCYSDMFCAKYSESLVKSILSSSNHPLPYIRVNGVLQQFGEFIDCYMIEPGQSMYRAPEERIVMF